MRSSELDPWVVAAEVEARLRGLADRSFVVITFALSLGLALRLADLGRESFWLDEAGRAAIASLPLVEIPPAVAVIELSPPLYHFLLHGWVQIFGGSDVAIRLLSAILVVPTVPLAWSVGKTIGGRAVGAVVALLAAVNPFAVYYGREAAMYALLLPLSLGMLRAAMAALATSRDSEASSMELRRQRTRGLAAYVVLGILTLYTHYYAIFLLASVAAIGIARSASQRSRHGLILWIGAHAVIALAFLPWLAVMGRQAALAASVFDWSGVDIDQAVVGWSGTALADGAPGWESALSVVFLLLASALGLSRLDWRTPSVWLVVTIAFGPILAAAASSAVTHSFRERGLIVSIGATWVLLAAAVAGRPRGNGWDQAARGIVAVVMAVATLSGLDYDRSWQKEAWRAAAHLVAEGAGPSDPIFFVHYGAQLAFDRYFDGPQPRVGLPEGFTWEQGYTARYLVTTDDVSRRVPPIIAGRGQVWAVLSHDQGRGSEHLIAALDRWGTRLSDVTLNGVRVVRYSARVQSG